MKSILKSTLTIIAVLALSIGATSAYFTDSTISAENIFTSGKVDVNLSPFIQPDAAFIPGYTHSYQFTVANPGTLPINIKGYFGGGWSDESLSNEVISFKSLEYRDGDSWVELAESLGVNEEFELVDQVGTPIELATGESAKFRTTFSFSEDAGNEYQEAVFSTELHIAARQAQNGADWPTEY